MRSRKRHVGRPVPMIMCSRCSSGTQRMWSSCARTASKQACTPAAGNTSPSSELCMLQQKCCCSLCVVQPVDVPKLTSGVQVTLLPLLLCCCLACWPGCRGACAAAGADAVRAVQAGRQQQLQAHDPGTGSCSSSRAAGARQPVVWGGAQRRGGGARGGQWGRWGQQQQQQQQRHHPTSGQCRSSSGSSRI